MTTIVKLPWPLRHGCIIHDPRFLGEARIYWAHGPEPKDQRCCVLPGPVLRSTAITIMGAVFQDAVGEVVEREVARMEAEPPLCPVDQQACARWVQVPMFPHIPPQE